MTVEEALKILDEEYLWKWIELQPLENLNITGELWESVWQAYDMAVEALRSQYNNSNK